MDNSHVFSNHTDEHTVKRIKIDQDVQKCSPLKQSIFSSYILSQASQAQLQEEFTSAQPYTHCVLRDVFNAEDLRLAREEIINNVHATYKETDLFKVFQTGDLGNLAKLDSEAAAKLPTLMRLKDALYSEQMRELMRAITGCGELSDKIDCSCNVYAEGGHLLCHDDVIGTRRVSWIVYLTDPDEPWTVEEGGALELYPQAPGEPHTPDVFPTVNLLPTFNTMAVFTVQPGKSFHAVQEVFTADKPRMSISGWYHAPQEPEDASKASLQQLQQIRPGQDMEAHDYFAFTGSPSTQSSDDLSDDDLSLLVRYINPSYLAEENWPKVQAKFQEDGSIQLQNFLKKALADRIVQQLVEEDRRDGLGSGLRPQSYAIGVGDGWVPVGPPHKQRYLRYQQGSDDGPSSVASCSSCGSLLQHVREKLFSSGAFCRLIQKFTTLKMISQRCEVRRFRPGLDYTVAHYGILTKDPRLDVVLCFVDSSAPSESIRNKPSAASRQKNKEGDNGSMIDEEDASNPVQDKGALWDVGEVGGFEAYLLADDDKEGAGPEDTYRVQGDESGVLNVSAAANSLNLVLRDEGLMKFVKYLSYLAPGSRWDVAMECVPEDDSSSEDEAGC
ncbi:hypothetical protein CEUSTIGMA_g9534.t1 [Chlamydomonas eustigma]|uniref:Fe2OG dioxygenase domain-containing protein n=1 Tax=Chlamydomonas eustigma TaxID=1157962 RepID=A0A250XGE9_9CHLO|nr:hypothetical protein CEUSTIGMA_g9534.t1 [Chlamydomonas eustigma]|eukprot:GAX82106.1 hypothetical protein CEUSTIGMA_g9534.t1 [Chlamydomonas eustigma]